MPNNKRDPNKKAIHLWVDKDLLEEVKELAARKKMSVTMLVTLLLMKALDR